MDITTLVMISCVFTAISWATLAIFVGLLLRFGVGGVMNIFEGLFNPNDNKDKQTEGAGLEAQGSRRRNRPSPNSIRTNRGQNLDFPAPNANVGQGAQGAGTQQFGVQAAQQGVGDIPRPDVPQVRDTLGGYSAQNNRPSPYNNQQSQSLNAQNQQGQQGLQSPQMPSLRNRQDTGLQPSQRMNAQRNYQQQNMPQQNPNQQSLQGGFNQQQNRNAPQQNRNQQGLGQQGYQQQNMPQQNPNQQSLQGGFNQQQNPNQQQGFPQYRPSLRNRPTDSSSGGLRSGRDNRKGDDYERFYGDQDGFFDG